MINLCESCEFVVEMYTRYCDGSGYGENKEERELHCLKTGNNCFETGEGEYIRVVRCGAYEKK